MRTSIDNLICTLYEAFTGQPELLDAVLTEDWDDIPLGPELTASRAAVIQTSSIGARLAGRLDVDDLDHDRNFGPVRAYNAAKLEDILFTRELHRRYHAQGISAAAFYPGNVATSFGTKSGSRLMRFITTNPVTRRALLTTPERGAGQLVWLAEGQPGADWQSGTYYHKRKPGRISRQALDPSLARHLWERSEQLTAPPTAGKHSWPSLNPASDDRPQAYRPTAPSQSSCPSIRTRPLAKDITDAR